jgi:hypothetical protein
VQHFVVPPKSGLPVTSAHWTITKALCALSGIIVRPTFAGGRNHIASVCHSCPGSGDTRTPFGVDNWICSLSHKLIHGHGIIGVLPMAGAVLLDLNTEPGADRRRKTIPAPARRDSKGCALRRISCCTEPGTNLNRHAPPTTRSTRRSRHHVCAAVFA